MENITKRLHENRQIELAKSILEANGYEVTKKLEEDKKDEKYIIVGVTTNGKRVFYNAKDDTFSTDKEDASVYAEYDIARDDWMDISRTGFKRVFIANYSDTDIEESTDEKGKLAESEDTNVITSGCIAYPSESERDPIVLKLGEDYPIILSIKIEDREEAQKVYDNLVKALNDSVADAVDYCMRRGFSISYNSNHLW